MVAPGHRATASAPRSSLGTTVRSRRSGARTGVSGMASSAAAPKPSMVPAASLLWNRWNWVSLQGPALCAFILGGAPGSLGPALWLACRHPCYFVQSADLWTMDALRSGWIPAFSRRPSPILSHASFPPSPLGSGWGLLPVWAACSSIFLNPSVTNYHKFSS